MDTLETRPLYDRDFVLWTQAQADALRRQMARGGDPLVDYVNLIEEVESLGRRDVRSMRSLVEQILVHLLKLEHAPDIGPREHWRREVAEFRLQVERLLDDSPSLRAKIDAGSAWSYVRRRLAKGLETPPMPRGTAGELPERCPYDLHSQVLADDWFPPNRHGIAP